MSLTGQEIDLYLSLDSKYQHAFKKLIPGWVFEQPAGISAPFSHQQEVLRRPINWKLFPSFNETFQDHAEILVRRNYWIPDDAGLIASYAGQEINSKLEPGRELKIDWNQNLEDGGHILIITCGDSEFQEIAPTQRGAALKILINASRVIKNMRLPSISQLRGEIDIVQDGWNNQPTIIGSYKELDSFKNKNLEYWIDTGHGSFSPCLGKMHCFEGDFYLLESALDRNKNTMIIKKKTRKIRRVK